MRISGRRSALYGSSFLVLAVLAVWSRWPEKVVVPPPQPEAGPVLEITKYFGSDETLRAALQDAYRLAPDRRFELAFSEVYRILGSPALGTSASVPPAFPELAEWSDVMPLLEAAATESLSTRPLNLIPGKATPALAGVTHVMDKSWTGGTLESLAELEKLWAAGNRQEALFRRIVRAQARLSFQLVDDTRQADLVGARALALVAIARASKLDVPEDEALVAASLGYWKAARASTASMPAGSAVRAFLERRDPDLRKLARTGADGAIARYLLLRRMTALQDAAGVDQVVGLLTRSERESEQVIAAYIALGRFGTKVNGGVALVATVLDTTRREGGVKTRPAKGSSPITLFEEALAARPPIQGTFHDEEHRRAFRRAHFYTGLFAIVKYTVDELGSAATSDGFRAQLGTPPAGPGADFVAWLDVLGGSALASRGEDPGGRPRRASGGSRNARKRRCRLLAGVQSRRTTFHEPFRDDGWRIAHLGCVRRTPAARCSGAPSSRSGHEALRDGAVVRHREARRAGSGRGRSGRQRDGGCGVPPAAGLASG